MGTDPDQAAVETGTPGDLVAGPVGPLLPDTRLEGPEEAVLVADVVAAGHFQNRGGDRVRADGVTGEDGIAPVEGEVADLAPLVPGGHPVRDGRERPEGNGVELKLAVAFLRGSAGEFGFVLEREKDQGKPQGRSDPDDKFTGHGPPSRGSFEGDPGAWAATGKCPLDTDFRSGRRRRRRRRRAAGGDPTPSARG